MKILKRNQIIILVTALMLVTAGYLNFKSMYNNETVNVSNTAELNNSEKNIGDAALVNNKPIEDDTTSIPNIERSTDAQLVSSDDSDYYFENSRLDRDKMYSQMLETYQKMYETGSQEQKTIAVNEISKINTTKNAIMICENLIKTKGVKDLIIFVNDTQISVVIDDNELVTEKVAQIQNIISREMNVDIANIHISKK